MRLQVNDLYGGVVGTVLASVMLAVVPADRSPGYAAQWIVVGVAIAAITRSYGQHVSTHQAESESGFWATEVGATDDAGLVERLGVAVRTVPGDPLAFKITTPLDLLLAEAVLARAT